jgi:hypothetical protein
VTPPTITAHDLEQSRAAAIQIAVLALEASRVARERDPIGCWQFDSIVRQAHRTIERADNLLAAMRGVGNG